MKKYIFFVAILLFVKLVPAQQTATAYNKNLADSLGADTYGMRLYQFVLLKTGDSIITHKEQTDSLFRGHMKNIDRLVQNGKLIVAGPFAKNLQQYRGLFIFTTKTAEETTALLTTDPAIKAGLLKAEVYSWYGSAALPLYLPFHKSIEKTMP